MKLRWLIPIAFILPLRLYASGPTVGARVATVTINPNEVTTLHLRPEFESTSSGQCERSARPWRHPAYSLVGRRGHLFAKLSTRPEAADSKAGGGWRSGERSLLRRHAAEVGRTTAIWRTFTGTRVADAAAAKRLEGAIARIRAKPGSEPDCGSGQSQLRGGRRATFGDGAGDTHSSEA
jgi:hypothetical protein